MFYNFFPPENRLVYEVKLKMWYTQTSLVWQYIYTIRRMHFAYNDTLRKCNSYCFSR